MCFLNAKTNKPDHEWKKEMQHIGNDSCHPTSQSECVIHAISNFATNFEWHLKTTEIHPNKPNCYKKSLNVPTIWLYLYSEGVCRYIYCVLKPIHDTMQHVYSKLAVAPVGYQIRKNSQELLVWRRGATVNFEPWFHCQQFTFMMSSLTILLCKSCWNFIAVQSVQIEIFHLCYFAMEIT